MTDQTHLPKPVSISTDDKRSVVVLDDGTAYVYLYNNPAGGWTSLGNSAIHGTSAWEKQRSAK